MKKSIIFFLTMALGFASFAQLKQVSSNAPQANVMRSQDYVVKNNKSSKPAPNQSKAIVWSNNFSNPSDWASNDVGNPGNSTWIIDTTSPKGQYSSGMGAIQSTTASNKFALYDSDRQGELHAGVVTQKVYLTYTGTINTTGHSYIRLKFQQYYRKYHSKTYVEISNNNGSTWTQTEINTGVAVNDATTNPNNIDLNISAVAGNQANVKLRFFYDGEWDYAWMIDDITIEDAPSNFVEWGRVWFFNGLSQIPHGHTLKTSVFADVRNEGTATQHNVALHAQEIVSSTSLAGTAIDSITFGTNDTVGVDDFFTFGNTNGVNGFTFYASSTENPKFIWGDTLVTKIGDTVFAKDNNILTSNNIWAGSGSAGMQAYELGSEYIMGKNCTANGVQFRIYSASANATVKVKLYKGMTTLIAESDYYQLQASDIPTALGANQPTVYVRFTTTPTLTKDTTYLAVVETYGGTDSVSFALGGDFPQPDATWFLREAGETLWTWYTNDVSNVPHIRLIVDGTPIGVQENIANNFILNPAFPNPASEDTKISYELKNAAKVSFKLTDLTGRVVMSMNKGIQEAGQHNFVLDVSKLAAGTYFYTLTAGEAQKTLKMIVR